MNNHPRRSTWHWLLGIGISLVLFIHPNAGVADEDSILWTARWNHDGSRFAVGGENVLWVFDSETLEKKSLLPYLEKEPDEGWGDPYMAVTRIAWHPNDRFLAVSSQGRDLNTIFDTQSKEPTWLAPSTEEFGRGISWSPDGTQVAYTMDDRLRIATVNGSILYDIPRYKDAKGLTSVEWRPTGDRLVTLGARITMHDTQGQPMKQVMHRPEAEDGDQLLLSAAWHPSGEFFVVGDYGTEVDDPVLQFWSAEATLIRSIPLPGDAEVRDVSWNHDGTRLASASSKLQVWSQEGELLHASETPDLLWGVDWSPGGDRILTSSIDRRVTLWSADAQVVTEVVVPEE